MKFNNLTYSEKEDILKDLSSKIYVIGARNIDGQYLHINTKRKANTNNVKAILRNFFDITMTVEEGIAGDTFDLIAYKHVSVQDIYKLCKIYLEFNTVDLDYSNRFDPMNEKNTVSKRVCQYGKVRYDLLNV